MLTLKGKLRLILNVPATTNQKTGEVYKAHTTLQIETTTVARGIPKLELHNITVTDAAKFRDQVDKLIELPVRAYAPGARVTLIQAD